MPFLVAAVVMVGFVGLLNLLLMFGVIRRLREHRALLAKYSGFSSPIDDLIKSVGERPDDFTATTSDASTISVESLTAMKVEVLVGFFAAGCTACEETLPLFVERAAVIAGGRGAVLAVVVTTDAGTDAEGYVASLGKVGQVVVEDAGGAVGSAFGVGGYPAFAILGPDGTIAAVGDSVLGGVPTIARA